MRFSNTLAGGMVLAVSQVSAFPAAMLDMMKRDANAFDMGALEKSLADIRMGKRFVPPVPGFDAAAQYVSTTGQYAFVAPDIAGGDQRGPCPGLNAMANHGYIPHNGVATIDEFIQGTYQVFGMGVDLAAFLAVYGAVIDGDGTQWSIGGPVASGLLQSIGLLGTPQGISGSHNKYESDVSPTRPDLFEYGNDYKVIIDQFQGMFDLQPDAATANYDLNVLTQYRATRFQQSIENNPYFFNAPFSGVIVQPAAYTFIYRFMANKSAEHPEGLLNQDVLKSFFSITGESGAFTWTEGYERIPDNWYKRAIGDEYTIPYFALDAIAAAIEYPQFADVGGNTGKVNTFTGLDLKDLTGGVFNSATLAEGDNFMCYTYQLLTNAAPDLLKPLFADITAALSELTDELDKAFGSLGCPKLESIQEGQFAQFPGSGVPNTVFVTPVA